MLRLVPIFVRHGFFKTLTVKTPVTSHYQCTCYRVVLRHVSFFNSSHPAAAAKRRVGAFPCQGSLCVCRERWTRVRCTRQPRAEQARSRLPFLAVGTCTVHQETSPETLPCKVLGDTKVTRETKTCGRQRWKGRTRATHSERGRGEVGRHWGSLRSARETHDTEESGERDGRVRGRRG